MNMNMNERFHTLITKSGEDISLSYDERTKMRGMIREYMAMKPLRIQSSPDASPSRMPSPVSWLYSPRFIIAALLLSIGGSSAGISSSAQSALPGDLLYPIKTRVVEPVQGALAISATQKTAWAVAITGERVQEAVTLAAAGRLSSSTQQELQAGFQAHAQEATAGIAELAAADPAGGAETAVRFQAQLAEYSNMLSQVGSSKGTDVAPMLAALSSEGSHIAAMRESSESKLDASSSMVRVAAQIRNAAQAQIDESGQLAQSVSESLSTSSAGAVAMQLQNARSSIEAGDTLASKSSVRAAIGAFQGALSTSEALGVFLHTSSDIHAAAGLVVGEPHAHPDAGEVRPTTAASIATAATSSAPGRMGLPQTAASIHTPGTATALATSSTDSPARAAGIRAHVSGPSDATNTSSSTVKSAESQSTKGEIEISPSVSVPAASPSGVQIKI